MLSSDRVRKGLDEMVEVIYVLTPVVYISNDKIYEIKKRDDISNFIISEAVKLFQSNTEVEIHSYIAKWLVQATEIQ